jgi:prolyl oligopeptidase
MILRALASALAMLATAWVPAPAFAGAFVPPDIPIAATVESFFGQTVHDPNHSPEEPRASEVADWFRAQNNYARRILDALPGRTALAAHLAELDRPGIRLKEVQSAGNQLFFLRQSPGEGGYRLYARDMATGTDELLVDPDRYAQAPHSARIAGFRASPNGRRIAFGISLNDTDGATLYIIDVATRMPVGAPIARAESAGLAWRFDSTILFYAKESAHAGARPAPGVPAQTVWMRTLGIGVPDSDVEIFGSGLDPDVAIEPGGTPSVRVSPLSPFAVAMVRHGAGGEISLYTAPLTQLRGTATPWRKLAGPGEGVTDFALRGEYIYLLTARDASHCSIVRWSLSDTRPLVVTEAEVVVSQGERILRGLAVAKDALYVRATEKGSDQLLRLEYNVKLKRAVAPAARGKTRRGAPPAPAALPKTAGIARGAVVQLPTAGSIEELATDPLRPGALVRLSGLTDPPSYLAIDGKTGEAAHSTLLPPARADWSAVTSAEVMVHSQDGANVPLSIVYGRNAARDGSAPLLIEAYGVFGASRGPAFWPSLLAWLERGGVYAVAHVRGGGEAGTRWHRDSARWSTSNSGRDLITAAEWLIGARWTSPARIAALGRGAGAFAVSDAMTARPELFAAIISEDGPHAALRPVSGAASAADAAEIGTASTADGVRDLGAMSSHARIEDGVPYPAALLTTRFGDSRVDAWDAGKVTARLQAANAAIGGSGKPVLLRVNLARGDDTTAQIVDGDVDLFSFLFWQTGAPGFALP